MDELLRSLQEEGRRDDGGAFTLNPERALELVRRYPSPHPERYPLMVVAAANALGATRLTLTGETSFRIEGAELERHEVEGLFGHLLGEGPLRYLGLALLMADQLEPAFARLSCNGVRLTLRKAETLVEKVPPGPLTVEVRSRRVWFASGPAAMAPSRVLQTWARFSTVPIVLEKTPLERRYRAEAPTLAVGGLEVEAPLVERVPSPGAYEAALSLAAGGVWGVADGVAYPVAGLLPDWLSGVVLTPLARPDLSLGQIVVSSELQQLAEALLVLLGGLIERLIDERGAESASVARRYAAHRGELAGMRLLQRLLQAFELPPDELCATLLAAAELEVGCGFPVEAEGHLRLALGLIRERPRLVEALHLLAGCLRERQAPPEERLPILRQLLQLLDKAGRPDPRQLEALDQLALLAEGDEARRHNVRLLELREAALGTNHALLTPILNRLTRLCGRQRPLDAEHYRQRSLEIWSYHQGRGCEEPPDA